MALWWPEWLLANRQPSVTPKTPASWTSEAWASAAPSKAGPEWPWKQRVCPEPLCLLTTQVSMPYTVQGKGTGTSLLGQEMLSHQSLNTHKGANHYIDILSLEPPSRWTFSTNYATLEAGRQGRGQLQNLTEKPLLPSFQSLSL